MIHPRKLSLLLSSQWENLSALQDVQSEEDTSEEDLAEWSDEDELTFLSSKLSACMLCLIKSLSGGHLR